MKHKMYNRFLSVALALALVVGMLPGMTFAGAVDTTAPQSQAEQIAEPTEEPEMVSEENSQAEATPTPAPESSEEESSQTAANAAPQAEARVNTQSFTVQFVDTEGESIYGEQTYNLGSQNNAVSIQTIANQYSIDGYSFAGEAYIQQNDQKHDVKRVKYESGWFGSGTLKYSEYESGDQSRRWLDWPDDGNWWGEEGNPYPLVLVYEKNEEPEPAPDSDVYITDTILTDGMLNANVNDELAVQDVSYKWYRSETGSDNTWTEVVRTRVTGTEYNLNEDTKKLNAALDKYLISSEDDSIRYYYYIEAFDANGESLGRSEVYQVPYYDALQNGSFETPKADHWNNQLPNGTDNLYWLTTAHDSQRRDIEIVRSTNNENFRDGNTWKTFQRKVQEIYGPTAADDGVQFAELNAEAQGALYQDVLTVPGSTVYWSLAHAARQDSKPDEMKVVIAPADKVQNITTQTQLLNFIELHPEYVQKPNGSNWDGTITSLTSDWTTYTGNYSVPSTQYVTRFFFVSLEGDTLGNLLDDISFSREVPKPEAGTGNLTVTKRVEGMDTIPENYQVRVTVSAAGEQNQTYTFGANNFKSDGDNAWVASYTFRSLPVSTTDTKNYTVKEEVTGASNEYTFNSQSSIVETNITVQEGETVSTELKNVYTRNTGTLVVTKTFYGITANQIPNNFQITVAELENQAPLTISNADEESPKEVENDGIKYTWTISNVPLGTYNVTEANYDVDGYNRKEGEATTATAEVTAGETATAALTNTYTPATGKLTITKVLENSQQATNGKPVFDFKITSQEEDGTVYYVHIDMSNPETNNKELTLPAGNYKVEELDSLNYEIKSVTVNGGTKTPDAEGQITIEVGGSNANVTVEYTNTADDTKIPSDSGATQNNPDWTQEGIVTWHKDDKITCNPEDPGKKPDSTEN